MRFRYSGCNEAAFLRYEDIEGFLHVVGQDDDGTEFVIDADYVEFLDEELEP